MTALLILVSYTTLKATFATTSAVDCPQMCDCYSPTPTELINDVNQHIRGISNNTLAVDCTGRAVNGSILAQELDSLLSDDELTENLALLSISNTPLTQVPMSVCRLSNLRFLILDDNRLSRLPDNCFTNMTALVWLSASRNNITEVQDGLFDGLSSLEELHLSENMIAYIGLRVFSNPNDLSNLWVISLENNRLRSLEPWPFIRGLQRPQSVPAYIIIRSNLISEFTNAIQWQFNYSHHSYAKVDVTMNYIKHLSDILHGWKWKLPIAEWYNVMRLENVDLEIRSRGFKVDFAWSYSFQCDCYDVGLLALAKHRDISNYIFKGITCSQPSSLANQPINQVPLIELVCDYAEAGRCPYGCRCVFRPANSTFHLYCSSANFTSLPLDLPSPPATHANYKLDFSSNKLLRRLENRPYFANASVLDVSDCAVEFVDPNAWREFATMPSELYVLSAETPNLTFRAVAPAVFLHGNKIESLSSHVTRVNLTPIRLTLNDNPWKCSCDNRWMVAWFRSLFSRASSNVGDVLCASPPRLEGRSILQSDEVEFCVNPPMRVLKVILSSTLSAAAGLLVLGFAVYRLRVRLYRSWKFHPFDRDECVGEDMDYDVFFCCSSDDEDPHGIHIVELTESKGYRVCYHERDFLPGELIFDNMAQSIERSKRTVCFLSSNFLQR